MGKNTSPICLSDNVLQGLTNTVQTKNLPVISPSGEDAVVGCVIRIDIIIPLGEGTL